MNINASILSTFIFWGGGGLSPQVVGLTARRSCASQSANTM